MEKLSEFESQLIRMLQITPDHGGFYFDVIVGVNRGGLIIGSTISRSFSKSMPVLSLYADRRCAGAFFTSDEAVSINKNIMSILMDNKYRNILVIDDIARSGSTITQAKDYLRNNLPPEKMTRNAVLIADETKTRGCAIDYSAVMMPTDNVMLPYFIFG